MRKFITLFAGCYLAVSASAQYQTLHDFKALSIQHDTIDFATYAGKKLMIVNTASFCGFTPQFTNLQQLYSQYKQYNFEIIGFPCNDFGQQDPYDDSTIYHFATTQYGVTFQLMHKISITASDTTPIYKWLQRKNLNGVKNAQVNWNFNKFLIDATGHWVAYYDSNVSPLNSAITNWIMAGTGVENLPDGQEMVQLSENASGNSIDLNIIAPFPQHYAIDIYSLEGKNMGSIYNGIADDEQKINYNYSGLSSGVYFIVISSNGSRQTIKHAFVR